MEDFDKLSVNPDPVAKKLSQVNMHSTQSKNNGNIQQPSFTKFLKNMTGEAQ